MSASEANRNKRDDLMGAQMGRLACQRSKALAALTSTAIGTLNKMQALEMARLPMDRTPRERHRFGLVCTPRTG